MDEGIIIPPAIPFKNLKMTSIKKFTDKAQPKEQSPKAVIAVKKTFR